MQAAANVPKRVNVADMLSDEERKPLGAWAYNTRDMLGLSVEQVVADLPSTPHPATLRKIEGGKSKPGRALLRELHALYRKSGREQGIIVAAPPTDSN